MKIFIKVIELWSEQELFTDGQTDVPTEWTLAGFLHRKVLTQKPNKTPKIHNKCLKFIGFFFFLTLTEINGKYPTHGLPNKCPGCAWTDGWTDGQCHAIICLKFRKNGHIKRLFPFVKIALKPWRYIYSLSSVLITITV